MVEDGLDEVTNRQHTLRNHDDIMVLEVNIMMNITLKLEFLDPDLFVSFRCKVIDDWGFSIGRQRVKYIDGRMKVELELIEMQRFTMMSGQVLLDGYSLIFSNYKLICLGVSSEYQ